MNQKLIISKMNVNVVADYAIDANALLLQIRSQLQHVILVELDKIINREQLSDVKINTLNLDFNTPSIDAWKDELPRVIHKEIQKKSKAIHKDITVIETVINLLKNKEVDQQHTAILALEEQIIDSGKIKNFTDRIFKEVGILKEALSAFSDSFLLEMVTELSKERVVVLGKIITETKSVQKEKAWIQKVTQRVDQIFSDLFIKIKAKSTPALQELLKELQEQTHFFYIADSNLQTVFIETERLTPSIFITSFCETIPDEKQLKFIQKEVEKITTSTSNEFKEALKVKSKELKDTVDAIALEENTTIVNAGVVLLHPFLPMLFQNLGLVSDKNEWISEEHQIAAIYLIHYIASGNMSSAMEEENEIEESELLIGKLLTGYPLETPILNFSNDQKTNGETKLVHPLLSNLELIDKELDEVLNALQNNWKPMKNCSWNGLRNDFLSRTGTLEINNKQQTITITPHTFDIQLQFLPWGIGIVKLSWMEEMVDVVWK